MATDLKILMANYKTIIVNNEVKLNPPPPPSQSLLKFTKNCFVTN